MDKGRSISKALSLSMNLGLTMALSVGIGFGLGTLADRKLHSYPWCTAVLSLMGMVAGFKGVFRIIREAEEGDDR